MTIGAVLLLDDHLWQADGERDDGGKDDNWTDGRTDRWTDGRTDGRRPCKSGGGAGLVGHRISALTHMHARTHARTHACITRIEWLGVGHPVSTYTHTSSSLRGSLAGSSNGSSRHAPHGGAGGGDTANRARSTGRGTVPRAPGGAAAPPADPGRLGQHRLSPSAPASSL